MFDNHSKKSYVLCGNLRNRDALAEVPVTFFWSHRSSDLSFFTSMAKKALLNALYFVILLLFANIANQLCYVGEPAQMQGKVTRSNRSKQNLDLASHVYLLMILDVEVWSLFVRQ